jgi:transporter family-2 protein
MNYVQLALWSFAAGAFIPVVGILNSGLARTVGGPAPATLILISVAWIGMIIAILVSRTALPAPAVLGGVRPYLYGGGLIIAFYLFSATTLAPRFGVGNFILFALTAQLVAASVIDQFGLFGAPLKPIAPLRALGVAVMVGGLILTQIRPSGLRV